jgi:predicted MFS family arabinose efflux permease
VPTLAKARSRLGEPARTTFRSALVALLAFLTVVDLFAAQAILPSLTRFYGVTPAAMSFAVNAATLGMAVAAISVALVAQRLDRRRGVIVSLLLLSVPTTLLAFAPGLLTFTVLRVMQGLCMATAFTLTLAYLGETSSERETAGAFAAYITGNVASNLVGRMVSAAVTDHFGLAANFFAFAALNVVGAALACVMLHRARPRGLGVALSSPLSAITTHLRNSPLLACFAIGFCILFAFIGAFTYVNFVLVRPPLAIAPMAVGAVYLVFLPSIVTTPLAGQAIARLGLRPTFGLAIGVALAGLPLLLHPGLPAVLAGLTLVAVGTFFAQAVATGFVGRAAKADRGAASGLYLASYFGGGLVGSAILGQVFDGWGWTACVAGIAVVLVAALLLGTRLVVPAAGA